MNIPKNNPARAAIYLALGIAALIWAIKFRADLEDDRYLSALSDRHTISYPDLINTHHHDYWRNEPHHRDED